jgi:hypothetical protein
MYPFLLLLLIQLLVHDAASYEVVDPSPLLQCCSRLFSFSCASKETVRDVCAVSNRTIKAEGLHGVLGGHGKATALRRAIVHVVVSIRRAPYEFHMAIQV